MKTEELLARLPEIEAKAGKWMISSNYGSDIELSIVTEDVPALCTAVRELAEEQRFLEIDRDQTRRERDEAMKQLHETREHVRELVQENEELKKDKQGLFDQWNDSQEQGQRLGQVIQKYKDEVRGLREENDKLKSTLFKEWIEE